MLTLMRCAKHFPALFVFALAISLAHAQKAPIQITADLSDAPRKLFHAEIDFPVSAGPLTLDFAGVDSGTSHAFGAGVFVYRRGVYGEWKDAGVAARRCESLRVSLDGADGVTTLHMHWTRL